MRLAADSTVQAVCGRTAKPAEARCGFHFGSNEGADVNDHRILAIALTPAEVALVVRAVQTYRTVQVTTRDDVLRMLANALSERERAWIGMPTMVDTQAQNVSDPKHAGEEVAS